MYKVKRTININGQKTDVWFGLTTKGHNGSYKVFLLTDDPNSTYNHAEPILSNIKTKEEAITKAIQYTKNLFKDIIDNKR